MNQTSNNSTDCSLIDPELSGQIRLDGSRLVTLSNALDLFCGKPCRWLARFCELLTFPDRTTGILPNHSGNYPVNIGDGNVIHFSQLVGRNSSGETAPNLGGVIGENDTHRVMVSGGGIVPSLLGFILNIVFVCSREEVVGIAARPVVASMTDQKPFWNGTIRKLPSQAMGAPTHSIYSNITVASGIRSFFTVPAFIL